MLNPENRLTLWDALKPPSGYVLDLAVGTSFTLSLDALLTAPAAFALFELGDEPRSDERLEPLGLLDAILRYADRIAFFCQEGQIAVPANRRLFAFLEKSVVPVKPPSGGIFHPKVWVLRYIQAETGSLAYRVLSGSRNLTLDRSWDLLLRIDSVPSTGDRVDTSGLSALLRALPTMATLNCDEDRRAQINALADELGQTAFQVPVGIDSLRLIARGLRAKRAPLPFPEHCSQSCVISPFVGAGLLDRIPRGQKSILIARPGSLDNLADETLKGFGELLVMDPDASAPARASDDPGKAKRTSPGDPSVGLLGLHAKLFAFEDGGRATVFAGSANATQAGFFANVEILAEMTASSKVLGIAQILGDELEGSASLRRLLLSYTKAEPIDASESAFLDGLRSELARVALHVTVGPEVDGAFSVSYTSTDNLPAMPAGVKARFWPITFPGGDLSLDLSTPKPLLLTFSMSFEALTPFLAVELSDESFQTQSVLVGEMHGFPTGRRVKLLRLLLGDVRRFLTYLLLLLSDDPLDRRSLEELLEGLEIVTDKDSGPTLQSLPFLEGLLRVLRQDPQRLRHMEDLIGEVDGPDFLPPEFHEIWDPIRMVAKERWA